MSVAYLLVNLGTPDSPEPKDVGRYLREFLMDPLVIDIPAPLRFLLVQGVIVPFRSPKSAALYKKIWRPEGSPLLVFTRELHRKVSAELGDGCAYAMRYGSPSIGSAMEALTALQPEEIRVLPLYPQYSLAATASSEAAVRRAATRLKFSGRLTFVPPFFADPGFLNAFEVRIRQTLDAGPWDRLMFSYHGLPERQVRRTARTPGVCGEKPDCCDQVPEANLDCYRAQCFETSRLLASRLGLKPHQWEVAFQSRLGRTPWIRPYSDERYLALPKEGVKRLVVTSPSFVADCLETLEEIEIRGRESFEQAGGESLKLVPSLNAEPEWVEAVKGLLQRTSYQPNK